MIYAMSKGEIIRILTSWIQDRLVPNRELRRSISELQAQSVVAKVRMDAMAAGDRFEYIGETLSGEWREVQPGLMARTARLGRLSGLRGRVTIMESVAVKDVRGELVHRHRTELVNSNQTLFVEAGRAVVRFYESFEKRKPTMTKELCDGEAILIKPDDWHSVEIDEGTVLLSFFIPPI